MSDQQITVETPAPPDNWGRLAHFAFCLTCASPLAFLVMALAYPPTNPKSLPSVGVQTLWWALCLSAPFGAVLGVLCRHQFTIRGASAAIKVHAHAAMIVGTLATIALPVGTANLNGIRRIIHSEVSRNCNSNVKQLGLAMQMYTLDYDDRFPQADTWNVALEPYTRNPQLFHCPETDDAERRATYALNRTLVGSLTTRVAHTEQTVMLFDSIPGNNLDGGRNLLPQPPRHGNGSDAIGFADGHVKYWKRDLEPGLTWTSVFVANPHGKKPP